MKKMWLYTLSVAMIAAISFAFVVFADDTNEKNIEFLSSYGWIVDKAPIERVSTVFPQIADDVFNSYNRLQREAGLELECYLGKSCVRYTYIVQNYPKAVGETVRANVLTVDGKAVGGDIMTVSSDGFMHSLVFPVS